MHAGNEHINNIAAMTTVAVTAAAVAVVAANNKFAF